MSMVSSVYSTASAKSTNSTAASSDLADYETFLTLLTTELQYQDPTDPMDVTEMVSQTAQLGMLSQLQTINTNVASYGALSLIGKTVTYQTTDSAGATVTSSGTVNSVVTSGGETYLSINNELVSPSYVVQVENA